MKTDKRTAELQNTYRELSVELRLQHAMLADDQLDSDDRIRAKKEIERLHHSIAHILSKLGGAE
jgi:hypothetical protein